MNFVKSLAVVFLGVVFSSGLIGADQAATTEVVYVANAENYGQMQVRYTGREWKVSPLGYLEGTGKGHRLLGRVSPGAGDFVATFSLRLARAGRESSVVVDGVSEVVMRADTGSWELTGRFFRAGDRPLKVSAPRFKVGMEFNLSLERRGAKIRIVVDGQEIYTGACGTDALSSLGLDPGTGTVNLNAFAATGSFPAGGGKQFDNTFGMQLRSKPASAREVMAPVIVREAPTNECSIVTRRDGTVEVYYVTKPESDSISFIASRDGGLTWGEPRIAFKIPGKAYYAVKVVEDGHGDSQAVYHLSGQGEGGYNGRLYEVYHTRQLAGREGWTAPLRVIPGYVGSIRGMTVLQSGRLVLGVGKAIPDRMKAPTSGPDFGWHDTLVYYSDDHGLTWQQSPDALQLELGKKFLTRYGAIEPVLSQLNDGRVWMLVRDRGGRLWESYSDDGDRWSHLARSKFISSDSPAELLRLRDGRLLLLVNACQNWGDPMSYAAGGREVLHAAISADDGKTWQGFREILHETNLIGGGDRGSAYPSAAETLDGKIAVVSGQGQGKHAIILFDPNWLNEKKTMDNLAEGPLGWTQYGDQYLQVKTLEDRSLAVAIPLKSSGLCGASWNFPMMNAGELSFKLLVPAGTSSLRLSLNDHFTRVDDTKAADNAVYTFPVPVSAKAGWREIQFVWRKANQGAALSIKIDGHEVSLKAQRAAMFGVNYLRVEFSGRSDSGDLLLSCVEAKATAP